MFGISSIFASFSVSPLKFEYSLENFDVIKDTITVTNLWDTPITLYSSKEDFIAGDDSGAPKFVPLEEQEQTLHSLSNWIEVEDKNITLAPKERRQINFSIRIPQNAEPGWHYSAIFFSPWIPWNSQVSAIQRLWVLLLVEVPGEVHIQWDLKKFEIGSISQNTFQKQVSFETLPISFESIFQNSWNVHIKPTGKIILKDENGEILKNVWKQPLLTPAGTYIWETLVDFIPVNETSGNVLPKSERRFQNIWEGFWYTVLNDDGSKSVHFKDLTTFYKDSAAQQAQFLMFWQWINTRTVKKQITAEFELSYVWKDKNTKEFRDIQNFYVTYEEKYIGLNYYFIVFLLLMVWWGWYYFIKIHPERKKQIEEEMRKKIMNEISENK